MFNRWNFNCGWFACERRVLASQIQVQSRGQGGGKERGGKRMEKLNKGIVILGVPFHNFCCGNFLEIAYSNISSPVS